MLAIELQGAKPYGNLHGLILQASVPQEKHPPHDRAPFTVRVGSQKPTTVAIIIRAA